MTQPDTLAKLMEQAQVFASAWSLVGGRFDSGDGLANAEAAKAELREMIKAALTAQALPAAPEPAEVWGWAIVTKDGCEYRVRARIQDFFGARQEFYEYTSDYLEKADREYPGNAPHRTVTLYATPQAAQQAAQAPAVSESEDALNYQWLRDHGAANSKQGSTAFDGDALRLGFQFMYWCSPDQLDRLLAKQRNLASELHQPPQTQEDAA